MIFWLAPGPACISLKFIFTCNRRFQRFDLVGVLESEDTEMNQEGRVGTEARRGPKGCEINRDRLNVNPPPTKTGRKKTFAHLAPLIGNPKQ